MHNKTFLAIEKLVGSDEWALQLTDADWDTKCVKNSIILLRPCFHPYLLCSAGSYGNGNIPSPLPVRPRSFGKLGRIRSAERIASDISAIISIFSGGFSLMKESATASR